jgi:hypothetical protein
MRSRNTFCNGIYNFHPVNTRVCTGFIHYCKLHRMSKWSNCSLLHVMQLGWSLLQQQQPSLNQQTSWVSYMDPSAPCSGSLLTQLNSANSNFSSAKISYILSQLG